MWLFDDCSAKRKVPNNPIDMKLILVQFCIVQFLIISMTISDAFGEHHESKHSKSNFKFLFTIVILCLYFYFQKKSQHEYYQRVHKYASLNL